MHQMESELGELRSRKAKRSSNHCAQRRPPFTAAHLLPARTRVCVCLCVCMCTRKAEYLEQLLPNVRQPLSLFPSIHPSIHWSNGAIKFY